jgi:hypothetical protein
MIKKYIIALILVILVAIILIKYNTIPKINLSKSSNCGGYPTFSQKYSSNGKFSTNATRTKGLVYQNSEGKIYQESSWKKFGNLGSIIYDKDGNLYTYSLPKINTIDNPKHSTNTIYKMDSKTGDMNIFASLPINKQDNFTNPFGILSLNLNCDNNNIIVSTVYDSTKESQKGVIYSLDLSTKTTKIIYTAIDALSVYLVNNNKELLVGSARERILYKYSFAKGELVTLIDYSNNQRSNYDSRIIDVQAGADTITLKIAPFSYNLAAPPESELIEISYILRNNTFVEL